MVFTFFGLIYTMTYIIQKNDVIYTNYSDIFDSYASFALYLTCTILVISLTLFLICWFKCKRNNRISAPVDENMANLHDSSSSIRLPSYNRSTNSDSLTNFIADVGSLPEYISLSISEVTQTIDESPTPYEGFF